MGRAADAGSMPELISKLTEREKERLAAEQEATAGIRAIQAKISKATEDLMELRRSKEHELNVLKMQQETQLRDTAYECRQRMQRANDALSQARGEAERAEARRSELEMKASRLRTRLLELQAHVQKRQDVNSCDFANLERTMDARMKRITQQSDKRIKDITDHTYRLQARMHEGVLQTQEEVQNQTAMAHVRAEGRQRFTDLCDLAQRTKKYEMSHEAFTHIKEELLTLWKRQSTTHSPTLALTS